MRSRSACWIWHTALSSTASSSGSSYSTTSGLIIPPQEQKPVEQGLPDGAEWVNVMLGLVEEKAERYVKMFGLCPCPRCVADVKALALTRLPAKYVVLPTEHKKPMLSLYQARYDGDVTTQVIYACKAVMDAPRHGAAQPGLASDRG